MNDRSQGVGSIRDGQIEVMVQRRLLYDDQYVYLLQNKNQELTQYANSRGVGEALNESAPIRTVHNVVVGPTHNSSRAQRTNVLLLNNPSTLLFAQGFVGNANDWFRNYPLHFVSLTRPLPPNVHLQTLRAISNSDNDVLLRLNHIYAVGEDSEYSQPVTVDLQTLFVNLRVTQVAEMNLSANQLKSDVKRYHWNTDKATETKPERTKVTLQNTLVELKPMEIRTFIVRLQL